MERFEQCLVNVSKRLLDAMWALQKGGVEIALVIDDDRKLVGTLTDGDVRRALLNGESVEAPLAPHVQRKFTAVKAAASRAEVTDMMRARWIGQIPIVADDGRVAGLHLLHEVLGGRERPNWALVMAGGRGTRLGTITDTLPKPMLAVAGRPILERIVLHMVGYGIRRIFLSVHYLAEKIVEHFGNGEQLGCRIEYLHESKPLGTGGALSLLPEPPTAPMVVLNGDLLTQFDVARLLDFHQAGGFKASIGVYPYGHTVPFGVIEVDGDRVTSLREKPTMVWQTNAGIYALSPELVARVPKDTVFPLPALVNGCLERGEKVGAYPIDGDWIDVGRRRELQRARGEIE